MVHYNQAVNEYDKKYNSNRCTIHDCCVHVHETHDTSILGKFTPFTQTWLSPRKSSGTMIIKKRAVRERELNRALSLQKDH